MPSVIVSLSLGEERETKTRRDRRVRLLKPLADDLKAARVALGRIAEARERIFNAAIREALASIVRHRRLGRGSEASGGATVGVSPT
jgi:hypothetical protein